MSAISRTMMLRELIITLAVAICLVQGWNVKLDNQKTEAKCERLSVTICRGLRYNLTAMPNFMGHTDQAQAERGVSDLTGFFLKILGHFFGQARFYDDFYDGFITVSIYRTHV